MVPGDTLSAKRTKWLRTIVDGLPARFQTVLRLHFGLGGKPPLTLQKMRSVALEEGQG